MESPLFLLRRMLYNESKRGYLKGCNKGGVTHIQDQALLADNNVAVGQTNLGTYPASFDEYMRR